MKVCGKRDVLVPECSDCSELEERVDAVEKCCDDAHEEIDTLATDKADKDYVDDSIETVNQTIVDVADTLGERIDNIITASEPSVTTLWEGVMESIGDSANLSEDVNDFDYLDIYYRTSVDESEGYYNTVRIPADQFANYTITVGGTLSPLGESPNLAQYLTQLSFVDDTATIDNIREWSWNGSQSSDASDDPQAETGVTIYRIDGVKEAGGNAEIADARIGVDGTVYPSLGDAIRGQIQDTRDMIPQLVKTVQGNPIVIDDAFGEVKNLDVELLPIQDLNGYSKPWAGGAGKNLLQVVATSQTVNGITFTVNDDGSVKANGTATAEAVLVLNTSTFSLGAGTYTASGASGGSNSTYYLQFRVDGTWRNAIANNTFTASTGINGALIDIKSGVTLNNYTFYPQIETGSTATTYEPYSNICPITGHDSVTVRDTGINQWDEQWRNGYYDGNTGNYVSFAGSICSKNYIPVFPSTTYYFKGTKNMRVFEYDSNKAFLGSATYVVNNTLTTKANARYIQFYVDGSYGNTYNNDISINLPSTDTAYHAYHGQSKTVTLPHTVYGGKPNITTGNGTETYGYIALTGDEVLGGLYHTSNNGWAMSIMNPDIFKNTGIGISNINVVSPYNTATESGFCRVESNNRIIFKLMDADTGLTASSTAQEVKDAYKAFVLANSPVGCYELADALDLSTTPTDITLYNGDNVVSSDGDMELTYVQDMAIVIRKIESQL